jgi:SAM-dependent methyltransferase
VPVVELIQRVAVGQPVRILRRAGLAPGAEILDAGAGQGRLVAAMLAEGWKARGIEPSSRSFAIAAGHDRPVERASVEEHDDEGLDAVVLWHVLEHLDDPGAALVRVGSWLKPDGLTLIGVPNLASTQARIAGGCWFHLDVPRHRMHFTPSGLTRVLEHSGHVPLETHHLIWEHNPHAMWMALLTRAGMTPGFPFHLLKRNVEITPRDLALLIAGIPLALPAVALEIAAGLAKHGGTIAVLARRAGREPG